MDIDNTKAVEKFTHFAMIPHGDIFESPGEGKFYMRIDAITQGDGSIANAINLSDGTLEDFKVDHNVLYRPYAVLLVHGLQK